jgi:hypothetical protein
VKKLRFPGGLCLVASVFLPGLLAGADLSTDFKVESPLNREGPRPDGAWSASPRGSLVLTGPTPLFEMPYDLHVTTTDGLDQHFKIQSGLLVGAERRSARRHQRRWLPRHHGGRGKDHRGEDWFKTWLYDSRAKIQVDQRVVAAEPGVAADAAPLGRFDVGGGSSRAAAAELYVQLGRFPYCQKAGGNSVLQSTA